MRRQLARDRRARVWTRPDDDSLRVTASGLQGGAEIEVELLESPGLARRRRVNDWGHDESWYLRPIQDFVARGITPAEELLEKFHGPWGGSVDPVYKEYAY